MVFVALDLGRLVVDLLLDDFAFGIKHLLRYLYTFDSVNTHVIVILSFLYS